MSTATAPTAMRSPWAIATILAGLVFAGEAVGAAVGAPAPTVQKVLDCRKIEDSAQRLACFDTTSAAMGQAENTGDLVTLDREQRRAARHQAFGLVLPTLGFLDRGEKKEDVDRITAKVVAARLTVDGKWIITLEDGAVWRQTDDGELSRNPHAGSIAAVRRAALGSFFLNLDGQRAIRVHRDS